MEEWDDYLFEVDEKTADQSVFVLIIYDIVSNKRRSQLANFLSGYGFRVQKSAFEAVISTGKYKKMLRQLPQFIDSKEDSVKVYKIIGKGQVTSFGIEEDNIQEEIILI